MKGQNPICFTSGYESKMHKIFPGLTSLDGYRKTVTMGCNMRDAIPEEEKVQVDYDTSDVEWFDKDQSELTKIDPAANRFNDSSEVRREEGTL